MVDVSQLDGTATRIARLSTQHADCHAGLQESGNRQANLLDSRRRQVLEVRQHRRLACPKQLRHLIEATKKNRITERQSPGPLPRRRILQQTMPFFPGSHLVAINVNEPVDAGEDQSCSCSPPKPTGSASFDHAGRGLAGNASLVEKSNDGTVLATPIPQSQR